MKITGIVLGLSLALGIAAAQSAPIDPPKAEKKVVEKKDAPKAAKNKKDPKTSKQTKGKAGEPKAQ